MRIDGAWRLCDDGVVRPIIWAEAQGDNGAWLPIVFLADCGADRTVLSSDAFASLGIEPLPAQEQIAGIGGTTDSVVFDSRIRMRRSDGQTVLFRGQYAAATTATALDMSVLGRDITNLLALVVDRPSNVVCLLSRGEQYTA